MLTRYTMPTTRARRLADWAPWQSLVGLFLAISLMTLVAFFVVG